MAAVSPGRPGADNDRGALVHEARGFPECVTLAVSVRLFVSRPGSQGQFPASMLAASLSASLRQGMTILSLTPIPAFSGSRSIKGTPVRSSPLDYRAESLGGLQWPACLTYAQRQKTPIASNAIGSGRLSARISN